MVRKGLLQIEWNQQKWPLLVSFLFISLFVPVNLFIDYKSWEMDAYKSGYFDVTFGGSMSFFLVISVGFAVTIAISQLGGERAKGNFDYYLTLPYSRGEMFMSKVVVGLLTLLTGIMLSYSLTGMVLLYSNAHSMYFHSFFGYLTIVVLMTYLLTLSAGSITGNVFAQGLTAFSVSILPVVLTFVIAMNIEVLNERFFRTHNFYLERMMEQVVGFSPVFYILYGGIAFGPAEWEKVNLWVPAFYTLLFFIIGYVSFIKQPYERNGNFFLWSGLNRPVQLLVMVIAILGFSGFVFFSSNHSFGGYVIGAIIGAVIGLVVTKFTIFKKTKNA